MYKLKKDLPLAKAGTIVEVHKNDSEISEKIMLKLSGNTYRQVANIHPFDIPEWLEEVKMNKRWRADKGGLYWIASDTGYVEEKKELFFNMDEFRYKTRNYFETEKEAQQHLDYTLALSELQDIIDEKNDGWIPDWENRNESKYYIVFDHIDNGYVCREVNYTESYSIQYIKSQEIAQEIIDNHKDLLDKVFKRI